MAAIVADSIGSLQRLPEPRPGRKPPPSPGNRVLIPLIEGQSTSPLLRFGDAIASLCPAEGTVLSLVEIPSRWKHIISSTALRSRELLRWVAANDSPGARRYRGRLGIQSRFTTDPLASIREALLETESDVALLEWPSQGAKREYLLAGIITALIDDRFLNLIVARPEPAPGRRAIAPPSVLVSMRGIGDAWLALSVAQGVAFDSGGRLTVLRIYDSSRDDETRSYEELCFRELAEAAELASTSVVEVVADRPDDCLLEIARSHDTVVLAADAAGPPGLTGSSSALGWAFGRLDKTVIVTRAASALAVA